MFLSIEIIKAAALKANWNLPKNIEKSNIIAVLDFVCKETKTKAVKDVADVITFIRDNRELSTTETKSHMVKFFTDEQMVVVGVTDRLCLEAYGLFKSGKQWKDRKKAS